MTHMYQTRLILVSPFMSSGLQDQAGQTHLTSLMLTIYRENKIKTICLINKLNPRVQNIKLVRGLTRTFKHPLLMWKPKIVNYLFIYYL